MATIPENNYAPSQPEPSVLDERSRALRDLFVAEYLIDYDQVAAAMRCGFPRNYAVEWSTKFLDEPYVQMKLRDMSLTLVDEEAESKFNRQRIKQQLMREAHYHGNGSSHAARVSALGKLASIYDLEAPKKIKSIVEHKGGVMRCPGAASLDDWESAALASQAALVDGQSPT